jgi:hypothetical protein
MNARPHARAGEWRFPPRFPVARVLGWATVLTLAVQADPDPVPTGPTLAQQLCSQRPTEEVRTSGRLRRRDSWGRWTEVPVRFELCFQGSSWITTYETAATNRPAAEKFVVRHSPDGTNSYFHGIGESAPDRGVSLQPLSAEQLYRPFADSEFWLADLGLEFLHWPEQRFVKSEMKLGRSCRVLESRWPDGPLQAYRRVVSWIDLEFSGLVRAEAYTAGNRLVKEFTVHSVKKGQLKEIRMRHIPSGASSRLEFALDLEDLPETK